MNRIEITNKKQKDLVKKENQKGSTIVIALLIMLLLLGFVAFAITRTNNETIAAGNDASETKTFEAAQSSLEIMTRNFDKVFDLKLNPNSSDLTRIESQIPPGFTNYDFAQIIQQTGNSEIVVMTGQEYQGLDAIRDEWELNTTVTNKTDGVQVALRRRFFNNRIPIFQFGIFYEDDMELHPGPRFDFGGRVHSNGNLFLQANTGVYFSSKVTAVGEIYTDVARNGFPWSNWNDNVYIRNASGTYVQLEHDMGSVLTDPVNGSPISANPDMPVAYENANWGTHQNQFQGNLLNRQQRLDLPIRIASNIAGGPLDYVELLKRGKSIGDLFNDGTGTPAAPAIQPVTAPVADSGITASERYYNKDGIRITLADSKAKLPGCASGTGTTPVATPCGVRLDGDEFGGVDRTNTNAPIATAPGAGEARGYQPRAMTDGYQATRINGERFFIPSKEIWIKIEAVGINPITNTFVAVEVTEDILSLGVTEQAPNISNDFEITNPTNYYSDGIDSRSIIKLQRFIMSGARLNNTSFITSETFNGNDHNYVVVAEGVDIASSNPVDNGTLPVGNGSLPTFNGDHQNHWKEADVRNLSDKGWIVPFPINMFDTREGLYNDNLNTGTEYGNDVPWNGVMSLIDIDVANLKSFLDGNFDTTMPINTPFALAAGRGLRGSDIPDANGWVVYVSDRRGDFDFDGEYDMEDIYGENDGIIQPGEDVNNNGTLQADYTNEAVLYTGANAAEEPDIAAVFEHKFYRRGVRLINGEKLPGIYDSVTPINTKGFTVASENGVYVLGNYNAEFITSVGTPTPSTDYFPQNTPDHIPASIAADAVTILSNPVTCSGCRGWSDAKSFRYPFSLGNRLADETTVRFAMLSGDTRSSLDGTPNQGGGDKRLSGGVHNFKRFLERWSGRRLNYSGSLINLYNSRNSNGAFKCCSNAYSPPGRNWVFDITFLDPNRLPPGTPFFQTLQLTGFERIN